MLLQNTTRQDVARSRNVMIVDDEPGVRMLLGLILQSHGYCVSASSNGEQAWQQLVVNPAKWDLVLTDERMPLLSGRALLRRIREAGMHMPVILVSGFIDSGEAEITQDGADGLLTKPFELDDVVSMVDTLQGTTSHPTTHR